MTTWNYFRFRCSPIIGGCCILLSCGIVDAEIMVPSAWNPGLSNVLCVKPAIGHDRGLHALPTAKLSSFLFSCLFGSLKFIFPHSSSKECDVWHHERGLWTNNKKARLWPNEMRIRTIWGEKKRCAFQLPLISRLNQKRRVRLISLAALSPMTGWCYMFYSFNPVSAECVSEQVPSRRATRWVQRHYPRPPSNVDLMIQPLNRPSVQERRKDTDSFTFFFFFWESTTTASL